MPPTASPLAPLAQQRWSVVAGILDRVAAESVLEIGCGLGAFGARLAERYRYVGVEQDEVSYRTAARRITAAGGRVVQGTVADVDGSGFDLVCAFEVLEHIEHDVAALAEWAARARPGGSVLLSVPAGPERYGAWDEAVGHFRRYSRAGLEATMREAGLEPVASTHYGWPLGFATEAVRNRLAGRPKAQPDGPMEARTGSSGRRLQPGPALGRVVQVGVRPFEAFQRLRPSTGVGLVALARRPAPAGV